MRFVSLCSGIEAASQAFKPLGWQAIAFSEIEPFCCAYLAERYPNVPNLGDMNDWRSWPIEELADADVLIAGTPCQTFSIAGLRSGLADDRGNLTMIFVEVANAIDDIRSNRGKPPVWVVWENVPGVYSDNDNAFGNFVGGLAGHSAAVDPPHGRGWTGAGVVSGPVRSLAWRTLDAQYFGVPQRRRRCFVLARGDSRGSFESADALLPIRESVRRDSTAGGGAREDAPGGGRGGIDRGHIPRVANTLTRRMHKGINTTLDEGQTLIVHENQRAEIRTTNVTAPLSGRGGKAGQGYPLAIVGRHVRKLTPLEAERLQGFPDHDTAIKMPDGRAASVQARFRALGNTMAVPVVRFIGERIEAINNPTTGAATCSTT